MLVGVVEQGTCDYLFRTVGMEHTKSVVFVSTKQKKIVMSGTGTLV